MQSGPGQESTSVTDRHCCCRLLADKAGGVCLKMELAGAEPRKLSRGSKGTVAGLQRCNGNAATLAKAQVLANRNAPFQFWKISSNLPQQERSKGYLGVARSLLPKRD